MRKRLFFLLFSIVVIMVILVAYRWSSPDIYLETKKNTHLHYDFVDISARARNRHFKEDFKQRILPVIIYRGISPVPTIGKKWSVGLKYDENDGRWQGRWPVPWNAPEGEYRVKIWLPPEPKNRMRLRECRFFIARRKPQKLNPGLCVMTMENMRSLKTMRVRGPDGEWGDWKKLFDWVEFSGANTFWYMAGQTSAYVEKLSDDFPWNRENLDFIDALAKEAEKRGIDFGYWVQCYIVLGPRRYRPNYEYGWGYEYKLEKSVPTRGISVGDKKRIEDIIKFIKGLNRIEEVDYIGLDYIRTAKGGLELVDEFVREMEVDVPEKWEKFSKRERMEWLGRIAERTRGRDIPLIDQWNWWRARQTAIILKRIKEEAGFTKPLWVFNLSWEKGWQHGQDVVMKNDAGVDIIAVMLYESDLKQLDCLIEDWKEYVNRGDANLIVGDDYDWPLHQYTLNPAGPEDFYNRTLKAMKNIYGDGPVSGLFTHDLARALWGRRGPYSPQEWILAGASCFSRLREKWEIIPIHTEIEIPEKVLFNTEFLANVVVKNCGPLEVKKIEVSILPQEGIKIVSGNYKEIESLAPGETERVEFKLEIDEFDYERGFRHMVASRTEWESGEFPGYAFKYLSLIEEPLLFPATTFAMLE
ncbi:hypothetical protein ES707_01936 [subsurface metagenome]